MPTRLENVLAGIMGVIIIAPALLIHIIGDGPWTRVIGTVIALIAVGVFAGYLVIRKSIYRNSPIEKKFGDRGVKIWDVSTRIICIIFFLVGSNWLINIGAGIKEYFVTKSLVTVE